MTTEYYFKELKGMRVDNFPHEFDSYLTACIRAEHPDVYMKLGQRFKEVESEIYAQHACNENNTEQCF